MPLNRLEDDEEIFRFRCHAEFCFADELLLRFWENQGYPKASLVITQLIKITPFFGAREIEASGNEQRSGLGKVVHRAQPSRRLEPSLLSSAISWHAQSPICTRCRLNG